MRLLTALMLARLEAYTPQQNRKHITALQAKGPSSTCLRPGRWPDVKTPLATAAPKATLDLSHWTDNTTPQDLYADTSTEIALNLARSSEYERARHCHSRQQPLRRRRRAVGLGGDGS